MTVGAYEDHGTGPAVLLAHGTLMDRTQFAPQVEALSDAYRVIPFDSRGHTDLHDKPYLLADMVDDTVRLMDELGLERCVLGGMSMGGFMAIEFALEHPDRLDGLVLIDVMAEAYTPEEQEGFSHEFERVDVDGPVPRDFAEWCAPLCFGATTAERNPQLIEEWVDRWSALPARSIHREAHSWLGKADRTDRLREIDVPVLQVHGAEDAVLAIERARPMAGEFPRVRFVEIPDAGHTSNLENPEAVNRALREFLDEEVYGGR
jgi:pimeloyl-ACP methyl ester carboxylesterase